MIVEASVIQKLCECLDLVILVVGVRQISSNASMEPGFSLGFRLTSTHLADYKDQNQYERRLHRRDAPIGTAAAWHQTSQRQAPHSMANYLECRTQNGPSEVPVSLAGHGTNRSINFLVWIERGNPSYRVAPGDTKLQKKTVQQIHAEIICKVHYRRPANVSVDLFWCKHHHGPLRGPASHRRKSPDAQSNHT